MENLACYIIRASFSQERMSYIREEAKVVYQSKDGKREKVFDASNGWRPCLLMSQRKASRWSDTTAIIATSAAEDVKREARMS